MYIQDLPHEILLQVAEELQPRDLLALSATSHTFRSIAQEQRLWYAAIEHGKTSFHPLRNYIEEYAWRHGNLAVDVQSDMAPRDEELFRVMTFFPMHRSYKGSELASLSPEYLPWATAQLASIDENLLILSCRTNDLVAHIYRDDASGPRHELLLLRNGQKVTWLSGLPDWPLCASFIDDEHVLVCGRFPAALVYNLKHPESPRGIALSSHTIHCLSFDNGHVAPRILLCGHYKGRGSMEVLTYGRDAAGSLKIDVSEENKFAGVTAIVSCAYLPEGSFVTYDNYSHIYLWRSPWHAMRKIDHDGIGDEIPSDMVYKMFYTDGQLVFIDQYKRQNAFTIRPGRQLFKEKTKEEGEEGEGGEFGAHFAEEEMRKLLFKQGNDMASLTRRILGI